MAKTVRRFDFVPCMGYGPTCDAEMREDPTGEWVEESDYAALRDAPLTAGDTSLSHAEFTRAVAIARLLLEQERLKPRSVHPQNLMFAEFIVAVTEGAK